MRPDAHSDAGRGITRHRQAAQASAWSLLRSHPRFMAFTAVALLWNLALTIVSPFFSVLWSRTSGESVHIGLLAATFSIWNIIGQRVWGRLNDRRGGLGHRVRPAHTVGPADLGLRAEHLVVIPGGVAERLPVGRLWPGQLQSGAQPIARKPTGTLRGHLSGGSLRGGLRRSADRQRVGKYVSIRGCFFVSSAGRFLAALLFLVTVRGDSGAQLRFLPA